MDRDELLEMRHRYREGSVGRIQIDLALEMIGTRFRARDLEWEVKRTHQDGFLAWRTDGLGPKQAYGPTLL